MPSIDPGFYGDDTDLVDVTPSGRIWLVERPDEGPTIRELSELPRGVKSYQGDFPPDFEEHHLARIDAASGETFRDRPPML